MRRSKTIIEAGDDGSDPGFVERWSRLKHEHRQSKLNPVSRPTEAENIEAHAGVVDAGEPAEDQQLAAVILTDEDMPDIETMTADSDYTRFLSSGVSDALRKAALRKLFHCDVFNVCDGLDDYDDDYTQFTNLGSVVTSDMRHQIELKAQRMAEQMLQQKTQLTTNDVIDDVAANPSYDSDDDIDNISAELAGERRLEPADRDIIKADVQLQALNLAQNPALETRPLVPGSADCENHCENDSKDGHKKIS